MMMVLSNVPWDRPWQYSSGRKRKREFLESFALENLPFHWLPTSNPLDRHHRLANFKTARTVTAFFNRIFRRLQPSSHLRMASRSSSFSILPIPRILVETFNHSANHVFLLFPGVPLLSKRDTKASPTH